MNNNVIIWYDNLDILSKLQPNQKLVVEGDRIMLDDRWFKGLRRKVTGNSREEIIEPLRKTFEFFIDQTEIEIIDILRSTENCFRITYPEYWESEGPYGLSSLYLEMIAREDQKIYNRNLQISGRTLSNWLDEKERKEHLNK